MKVEVSFRTNRIQRRLVSGSSVEIVELSSSVLFLHVAPCSFKPATKTLGFILFMHVFEDFLSKQLTDDAEAAVVERGRLGVVMHLNIKVQLLERPVVRLGHKLSSRRHVRLRNEQAAQPHVHVLRESTCT